MKTRLVAPIALLQALVCATACSDETTGAAIVATGGIGGAAGGNGGVGASV